jgi:hypothetical protein
MCHLPGEGGRHSLELDAGHGALQRCPAAVLLQHLRLSRGCESTSRGGQTHDHGTPETDSGAPCDGGSTSDREAQAIRAMLMGIMDVVML